MCKNEHPLTVRLEKYCNQMNATSSPFPLQTCRRTTLAFLYQNHWLKKQWHLCRFLSAAVSLVWITSPDSTDKWIYFWQIIEKLTFQSSETEHIFQHWCKKSVVYASHVLTKAIKQSASLWKPWSLIGDFHLQRQHQSLSSSSVITWFITLSLLWWQRYTLSCFVWG